jgi:hypothetical protein
MKSLAIEQLSARRTQRRSRLHDADEIRRRADKRLLQIGGC